MKNNIEYADDFRQSQRIAVAAESLRKWYAKKRMAIVKNDCELHLQLARANDPKIKSELAEQIARSQAELKKLNDGICNCAEFAEIGRAPERENVTTFFTGGEQRIMPTAAPARIPSVKDESVSTGRKKLTGFAVVYEIWTDVGGYFKEKIARIAFANCLSRGPDVRFLFNHDSNFIYGRTASGTLKLSDTQAGLAFWNDLLPGDPASDGLFARVQRGDISGCSFAFTVAEDDWKLPAKPGELPSRIILEIGSLLDVGPVVFPAYKQTNVTAYLARDSAYDWTDILNEDDGDLISKLSPQIKDRVERKIKLNSIGNRLRITRLNSLRERLKISQGKKVVYC